MFLKIIVFTLVFSQSVFGSWNDAENMTKSKLNKSARYRNIAIELVEEKLYFSALPWMKNYLISSTKKLDNKTEKSLSEMILVVGAKHFEILPLKYLKRSHSASMRYIIAKKLLGRGKSKSALKYIKGISDEHSFYAYAKNLEGTIYATIGQNTNALRSYRSCVAHAKKHFNGSDEGRMRVNHDYCIAGIARVHFAMKSYEKTDLLYLDIPKESPVWPELLFEEAWNSYYLKNYNRTLGKLVSYNAPVFDYIFNPEIDVLKALAYMKLCLYSDAKKVHSEFYKTYYKDARYLRRFIKVKGKKYGAYYNLMYNFENKSGAKTKLLTKLMKRIQKDPIYKKMKRSLTQISNEYKVIRSQNRSSFRGRVNRGLKDVLSTHKRIIGSYVRSRLVSNYAKLFKAFEGMSFIKLETLRQQKANLYSFEKSSKQRGSEKYIKRNEKQYFWNFNGEFWADELGDYVFALKSECR